MILKYLISLSVCGLVSGETNERFRLAMIVNVMEQLVEESFQTMRRFERIAQDPSASGSILTQLSMQVILENVPRKIGTRKSARKSISDFSQIDSTGWELALELGTILTFVDRFVHSFWLIVGLPESDSPEFAQQRARLDLLLYDWRNVRNELFELQLDITIESGKSISAFEHDAILIMVSTSQIVENLSTHVDLLHSVGLVSFPDSLLVYIDLSRMSLTGFKTILRKSIDILSGPDLLFRERVCKSFIFMHTLTKTTDQFVPSLPENDPKVVLTKAMIFRLLAEWPTLVKAFADLIAHYSVDCTSVDIL